ncbi:hypothetical protein HF888_01320 [Bermanella marisrubri]|uniref:Imelysin-like domain-containing protein n=1 Tax=Bermanella marisrubri TaxID=207949 RepID=Q1N4F1_9GAMM|nr:imelysin family protein [Bermanella marisrubri]EAT12914.1 hypothetical protein RED65_14497 [Oceanobacter sp. RED65] [Bermanella marisrubri]QIZ82954.1 hypothetical protein HF888_01320 [Bermanella marisrubri]
MKSITRLTARTILFGNLIVLAACDQFKDQRQDQPKVQAKAEVNSEQLLSAMNLYVYTQLSDALNKAQTLDSEITSLLHHPNPVSLEQSQNAWQQAYEGYVKVSFLHRVPRFEKPQYYENNRTYDDIRQRIDSWPIEPGYIDYLPQYPLSGIVNDLTLKISLDNLVDQHGFSDPRYASIGFHPLEFLLFAENSERSAKDFIPQENSMEVVATEPEIQAETQAINSDAEHVDSDIKDIRHAQPVINGPQNHNRRRDYLRILSADLVKQLQALTDRWDPANGYYAKQWRQPDHAANVASLYQGLVDALQTDLLEQHFQVLATQKPLYDLRSPFAQQDTANMQALLTGIENILLAENGFIKEIRLQDAELADKIKAQFERLKYDMKQLPNNWETLEQVQRHQVLIEPKDKTLQLLTLMYQGAESLGIRLKALPVSTD